MGGVIVGTILVRYARDGYTGCVARGQDIDLNLGGRRRRTDLGDVCHRRHNSVPALYLRNQDFKLCDVLVQPGAGRALDRRDEVLAVGQRARRDAVMAGCVRGAGPNDDPPQKTVDQGHGRSGNGGANKCRRGEIGDIVGRRTAGIQARRKRRRLQHHRRGVGDRAGKGRSGKLRGYSGRQCRILRRGAQRRRKRTLFDRLDCIERRIGGETAGKVLVAIENRIAGHDRLCRRGHDR